MHHQPGKVYFIGAGPGDPELLTVKAMRCLQQADVVLTDRLASPEIISQFVAPHALVIPVGKQCRRGASTPQWQINHLMILHASQGKKVVRLKGGDVSIFSNILDELEDLAAHDISYEIIPGITAASGAAAYASIPLTARGFATGVRFLTYYKKEILPDQYWKELAETNDTLVFYMSAETAPDVVDQLVKHKVSTEKLLAVVEQATTPAQRVSIHNLYDFALPVDRSFASPSLLIIGRVVALHHQFKWLENETAGEEYFKPVTGKLVEYHQHEKETKILTL